MTQNEKELKLTWKKVAGSTGPLPKPRHGHRVYNVNELMIIIGGGSDGIINESSFYNTVTNVWQSSEFKGDVPPGRAAFGLAKDGTKVYIFGGMLEYGFYSNDLYELQINKWEWKKLSPTAPTTGEYPCPRLGHSFTLVGKRFFVFGGLSNKSNDPKHNIPIYLNDLYILNINKQGVFSWEIPVTYGEGPSVRESHTAVAFYDDTKKKNYLVIYGGMNMNRLGDTWFLDTDSMKWENPTLKGPIPLPRSLHTATLIGSKMYVFGGWTPTSFSARHGAEWRCTKTLGCLNLKTLTWETPNMGEHYKDTPKARAGHCSIAIGGRMYIWSGRDGYRKEWSDQSVNSNRVPQACWNDMWFLETLVPQKTQKIRLVKTTDNSLELAWNPVQGVSHYLLQVQKVDRIMEPPVKAQTHFLIKPNLLCKPIVNHPTVAIPQMGFAQPISNLKRINIIKQEIISPAYLSPPKHIIVNPKSESSQSPNQIKPSIIIDKRSFVIAKPTTTFQVVKKMPLGLLGSFKFTDKDGTPVNTVPSTSKFRVIDNFKQPMLQRDRTLMHQKKLKDMKPSTSTDIEFPGNDQYDDGVDNIDQFDGVTDPEVIRLSDHHLGRDNLMSGGNDNNNENEESEQNEDAKENESSNILGPEKEIKMEVDKPSADIVDKWDTIDFVDDCRDIALSYISYDDWNISKIDEDLTSDNIPNLSEYKRLGLKTGTCYRFRVAGINSLGIGEFSEVSEIGLFSLSTDKSAKLRHHSESTDTSSEIEDNCDKYFHPQTVEFRTNSSSVAMGPPHSIRVCRQKNGVQINWMPPKNIPDSEINEYIVLMATKQDVNGNNKSYQFENIYCGKNTQCLVKYKTIQKAHVDNDASRPNIILRISAANFDNVHGPATQIKWIQDQPIPKMDNADKEVNNNFAENSNKTSINE